MVIASSLQDELQRAVQNRLENFFFFSFLYWYFLINRAAQGRNTDQQNIDNITESIFQPVISPEQTNQSFGYHYQQSYLTSALSNDKASLTETFQRIKIAGDVNDMSHIEDLEESVGPLLRALIIREKYN
jgi:hypothetical protein